MGKQTIRLFPPFFIPPRPAAPGAATHHTRNHSYIPSIHIYAVNTYPRHSRSRKSPHARDTPHNTNASQTGTNIPNPIGRQSHPPAPDSTTPTTRPDATAAIHSRRHTRHIPTETGDNTRACTPCLAAQTRPATPARHDGICYRKLQKKIARITAPCRHLTFINTQLPLTHPPQPSITCH